MVADRDDEQVGVVVDDPDGSALEGLAVVSVEDGEDDLASEPRLRRPPVDVEEPRVRRVRSSGQDLPPPAVGAISDRQVVGHDVHHHAHPPPSGRGAQVRQALRPAELPRDRLDVDGVVPMLARGARLQHGRQEEVGDAELRQEGHRLGHVSEGVAGVQLQHGKST